MAPPPPESDARASGLYRILGGIVHDLSNPLQALVMHAELAADEEASSEPDRRDAELEATRRMQTIVRALTELAAAGVHDRPLGDVARRFDALLSRRWTRLGLTLQARIRDQLNVPVPAVLEELLLLTGIELTAWLRTQTRFDALLALDVEHEGDELALRLGCDSEDFSRKMNEAMTARARSLTDLTSGVRFEISSDRIVLRCAVGDSGR